MAQTGRVARYTAPPDPLTRHRAQPAGQDGAVTQFSLFGAEAALPTVADLDGLLLAGGQWVRSADGARLSVLVADDWRVEALLEAFAERGLPAPDPVRAVDDRFAVRTAFCRELVAAANRWTRGAHVGVPTGFTLDAGGLRLWTVAAGRSDESGYLLATAVIAAGAADGGELHRVAGAQLARLGITAVALAQKPGPGWRITSAKRLRRFAELVGAAPPGAGSDWP
jgi:hypothetical protein